MATATQTGWLRLRHWWNRPARSGKQHKQQTLEGSVHEQQIIGLELFYNLENHLEKWRHAHGDVVPLLRESLGRQPVSQDQVIHVNPVHPGLWVPEPEKEQPALHIHLRDTDITRFHCLKMNLYQKDFSFLS